MKKFLSLVLAMIMTMSLVTISAGATEYKDLTDKDEIKYEEAVAVLNKIGVITGYSDGSFQPETELTRGAAAKIIVSLMIGPDAASALPNTSSPYPDVPAGHTFAGVISYCKTKGYISGYGDGNFKPAGTLTGYAFAKMLLGALGYSSDIERFTGSGWTMNVANVGNVAGLFDRISFDGAAAVTRDEACQLALNTLKATLVTYGGTSLINGTTGSYTIQGTQATPRTSNNRDINANIGRKDWYGGNNQGSDYLTLEFGEEHFKDLRLEHDRYDPAHDEFGRPSNEWSYKKVTIGTFPLPADFTFTTQVAHVEDTDGTKEKALGLRNYDLVADGGYSYGWSVNTNRPITTITQGDTTTLWQNGESFDFGANSKVADIADYTDNGTLVEVYVSYVDADWITDVVVIQTQLMEVDKVGSDYVSLDRVEPDAISRPNPTSTNGAANIGFNLSPIYVAVQQVKDTNEDCYNILKDLKSGDKVAVIPVTTDNGTTWEAAEVYVPETVSGTLTRVDTYGIGKDDAKQRGAVEITVGGTSYKIANWNDKMWDIQAEAIKATRKDVTLLMDKYGNALFAKDVGETNDFMVIGSYYQALSGNKICTFVHGWDIKGNELDLNLGSNVKVQEHGGAQSVENHVIGELVYYTSKGVTGDADYQLLHHSDDTDTSGRWKKAVWDVYTNANKNTGAKVADGAADSYEIKAANVTVPLADMNGTAYWDGTYADGVDNGKATHTGAGDMPDYTEIAPHSYYYDKGVKFIYVSYDGDNEVESIEFKTGAQNTSNEELRQTIQGWAAQAAVKDEKVQAVVIKTDSNDASVNRMLYVTDTKGYKEVDKDTNETFFEVEVAMFTSDGKFLTEEHIMVNKNLQIGDFATYTKVAGTKYEDNYYRVKEFTRHNTNPAVLSTTGVAEVKSTDNLNVVKHLIRVASATTVSGAALSKIDAGSGATNAQSYMLGDYRNAGTDLYNIPETARGVINTNTAEWLNATSNKDYDAIDSAEDLFKLEKVDFTKVKLDILLNEKPDSDGFRTAYLIVLKSIPSGTSSGTAQNGNVKYVETATDKIADLFASISSSNTASVSSFNNLSYNFDFVAPSWVQPASGYEFDVEIYLNVGNGLELWQTANGVTGNLVGRSGTYSRLIGNVPNCSAVEVRISDIKYDDVSMKFYANDLDHEITASSWVGTAPADHLTRTNVGNINVQLSNAVYSGYVTPATGAEIEAKNVTATWRTAIGLIAGAQNLATGNVQATGKGPAQIIITKLVGNTAFSIAKDGLSPALQGVITTSAGAAGTADDIVNLDATFVGETNDLAIDFTVGGATAYKMANIAAGDTVTVTVSGTASTAAPIIATNGAYNVSVVLKAVDASSSWTKTLTFTNLGNATVGKKLTDSFVMPSEHIKIDSVTITKSANKLTKVGATAAYDATTHDLTVTFNEEIAKDAAGTDLKAQITGAGAAKVNSATIDGKKLVINLATALADNDDLVVGAGKIVNGLTGVDDIGGTVTVTYTDATGYVVS